MVTVFDLAMRNSPRPRGALVHPDPGPAGDPGSFDAALAQLANRVGRLAAVS